MLTKEQVSCQGTALTGMRLTKNAPQGTHSVKKETQLWRGVCSPAQDFLYRAASGKQRRQPVTLATATSVEPLRGRKLPCSESKRKREHISQPCVHCARMGVCGCASMCAPAYTGLFKANVETLPQEPLPSSLRQDLSNPELTYV